jgi:hypothetical protein
MSRELAAPAAAPSQCGRGLLETGCEPYLMSAKKEDRLLARRRARTPALRRRIRCDAQARLGHRLMGS